MADVPRRGDGEAVHQPYDAVTFTLNTLNDPQAAWDLALPIHERLVRNELTDAGAEHYRRAAKRLAGCANSHSHPTRPRGSTRSSQTSAESTSDGRGSSRSSPAPGSLEPSTQLATGHIAEVSPFE